jgi:hypothetical protein
MAAANDVLFHIAQEDLPFGGIAASRMGRYHGRDGFITSSNARPCFIIIALRARSVAATALHGRVDRLIRHLASAGRWDRGLVPISARTA